MTLSGLAFEMISTSDVCFFVCSFVCLFICVGGSVGDDKKDDSTVNFSKKRSKGKLAIHSNDKIP